MSRVQARWSIFRGHIRTHAPQRPLVWLQSNPKAGFAFTVSYTAGAERARGGLVFVDRATGRFLTSTKITSLVIAGKAATITGVGKTNGGRVADFEAEATDPSRSGRLDSFTIRFDGYVATGTLKTGNNEVPCRPHHHPGCDDPWDDD